MLKQYKKVPNALTPCRCNTFGVERGDLARDPNLATVLISKIHTIKG